MEFRVHRLRLLIIDFSLAFFGVFGAYEFAVSKLWICVTIALAIAVSSVIFPLKRFNVVLLEKN